MNVPQPMPMSAPPPPPRKSGALKWILIGCGVLGFLGLIVCGGCVLWFGSMAKSALKVQEDVTTLLENNAEVREAIGDIKKVDMLADEDRAEGSEIAFDYRVEGSKGKGTARARCNISFTKIELRSALFETEDGRTIKLK